MTTTITAEATARAAAAYSRSGTIVDPDVFLDELDDLVEKARADWLAQHDAFQTSRPDGEDTTLWAALSNLLAVTAALRAALGYPESPTGPELKDQLRATETRTSTHDALRLHLASSHGDLIALGASDRQATNIHTRFHDAGTDHDPVDRTWNLGSIHQTTALNARRWDPSQFEPFVNRCLAGVATGAACPSPDGING